MNDENKITTIDDLDTIIYDCFSDDFDLSKDLYRENDKAAAWLYEEIRTRLISVLKLKGNKVIKNIIRSEATNTNELALDVIKFILKRWYEVF